VTAVTAKGMAHLLFRVIGRAITRPPSIRYAPLVPQAGGPVTLGAARSDGFTCYAVLMGPNHGPPLGGYSMETFSNRRVFTGAAVILRGIRNTLPDRGTVTYGVPPP
jgi:hypothetical protein